MTFADSATHTDHPEPLSDREAALLRLERVLWGFLQMLRAEPDLPMPQSVGMSIYLDRPAFTAYTNARLLRPYPERNPSQADLDPVLAKHVAEPDRTPFHLPLHVVARGEDRPL